MAVYLLLYSKMNSLNYKLNDVEGDGHCFFRSMYNGIMLSQKEDVIKYFSLNIDDENDGVLKLRNFTGSYMETCNNAKHMYDEIIGLHSISDDALRKEIELMYPLFRIPLEFRHFTHFVKMSNMYVSSIEVETFRKILLMFDIALIILSQRPEEWEEHLIKSFINLENKYAIVLVNLENVHYNYLSFCPHGCYDYETIIYVKDFIDNAY